MFVRVDDGLGQWEILGAAIQAIGSVASSFIGADATKYAARQKTKADLLVALAREKAELEAIKAQEVTSNVSQEEGTNRTVAVAGALNTIVVVGTVLALVGIATYVAMKKE